MSIKLYDDALKEKLMNWTKNTNVTFVGPNDVRRLFEVQADVNNDKPIQLPLIVLSRAGGYTVLDTIKRPLSYDGATLDANKDIASQLNVIPISITYQLDIYTRYFEEADEYTRNLVFNIVNYPRLRVLIPFNNQNYHHDSAIRMDPEVSDNSDIPERLISGQFTRNTINLTVDDAYLFDVRYRDVCKIDVEYQISDRSIEDVMKDITLR